MLYEINSLNQFSEQLSLVSLGIDLKKRTIAIVCGENQLSLSSLSLREIAKKVQEGVDSCSYNSVILNIPTLSSDLTVGQEANKYVLPMRNNIADIVESYSKMNQIDGFVFVSNDNMTTFGMLIGAIRANIPCLFVGGGFVNTASANQRKIGLASALEFSGLLKNGTITLSDLENFRTSLAQGWGAASDSYQANSGNILTESMGLALMGNSSFATDSKERKVFAFNSGIQITKMVENATPPRLIVTDECIKTAMLVDLAFGSSSTTVLNMLAVAHEAHCDLSLEDISDLASQMPQLVSLSTSSNFFMEDFAQNGGVAGILKYLIENNICQCNFRCFDNSRMSDKFADYKNPTELLPKGKNGKNPLVVLRGNIAEEGAIAFNNEVAVFKGSARVFDDEESALEAISFRHVSKGDVIVIRNEGIKSCPGMREIVLPIAMLKGLDMDKDIALITDGRVPNISRGIVVGNINKETCQDGLLHVIQNGDPIEINLNRGKISLDFTMKEIANRKKNSDYFKRDSSGVLQVFAAMASPSSAGGFVDIEKIEE